MASYLPHLKKYATGEKGIINCVLANATGADGKPIQFEQEGEVHRIGVGEAIILLFHLIEKQHKINTFWGRFFHSGLEALELKQEIEKLKKQLDYWQLEWTE